MDKSEARSEGKMNPKMDREALEAASRAKISQEGAALREMCSTKGWKILEKHLGDQVTDAHGKWLVADTEAATQKIRISAKVMHDIFQWIKSKILLADSLK